MFLVFAGKSTETQSEGLNSFIGSVSILNGDIERALDLTYQDIIERDGLDFCHILYCGFDLCYPFAELSTFYTNKNGIVFDQWNIYDGSKQAYANRKMGSKVFHPMLIHFNQIKYEND